MTRGLPWPVRPVPPAQRERYLAEGWWTDDTVGRLVDALQENDPIAQKGVVLNQVVPHGETPGV